MLGDSDASGPTAIAIVRFNEDDAGNCATTPENLERSGKAFSKSRHASQSTRWLWRKVTELIADELRAEADRNRD